MSRIISLASVSIFGAAKDTFATETVLTVCRRIAPPIMGVFARSYGPMHSSRRIGPAWRSPLPNGKPPSRGPRYSIRTILLGGTANAFLRSVRTSWTCHSYNSHRRAESRRATSLVASRLRPTKARRNWPGWKRSRDRLKCGSPACRVCGDTACIGWQIFERSTNERRGSSWYRCNGNSTIGARTPRNKNESCGDETAARCPWEARHAPALHARLPGGAKH
jgi:hypothetical protein